MVLEFIPLQATTTADIEGSLSGLSRRFCAFEISVVRFSQSVLGLVL